MDSESNFNLKKYLSFGLIIFGIVGLIVTTFYVYAWYSLTSSMQEIGLLSENKGFDVIFWFNLIVQLTAICFGIMIKKRNYSLASAIIMMLLIFSTFILSIYLLIHNILLPANNLVNVI